MNEVEIGVVRHFFDKIGVVAIDLTKDELSVGDTIRIKGHTTDFTSPIESIQIEHTRVERAGKGESIGIRVAQRARERDLVYKVLP